MQALRPVEFCNFGFGPGLMFWLREYQLQALDFFFEGGGGWDARFRVDLVWLCCSCRSILGSARFLL